MNIRKIIAPLALLAFMVMPLAVSAQGLQPAPVPEGTQSAPLESAILNIVNFFLILASIVAVVFIILGGVRYVISQGDESAAEKAKNTILYAVIGLIVIGLAAAIANFALRAVASV